MTHEGAELNLSVASQLIKFQILALVVECNIDSALSTIKLY